MFRKYLFLHVVFIAFFSASAVAASAPSAEDFKSEYDRYLELSGKKQWAEALGPAARALEMGKVLFGEYSQNSSALAYNYGLNLLELQKNAEAEKALEYALAIHERVYGADAVELIPVLMSLGQAMADSDRAKDQLMHYVRALELSDSHYGDESMEFAQAAVDAGVTLLHQTKSVKAREFLYAGHGILEKKVGEADARTGYAAFNIGRFELAMYNPEQAVIYFQKALAGFSTPDELPGKYEVVTHGFLVKAYEAMGQRDLATEHCLIVGSMTSLLDPGNDQPVLLVVVAPVYPPSANQRNLEGYVQMSFDVDELGFVKNPAFIERKGPRVLEDAVLEALERFRFAPRFIKGKPVKTEGVEYRFTFELTI